MGSILVSTIAAFVIYAALLTLTPRAQASSATVTLNQLYSFGALNDAGRPGSVIEGGDGVLYGTTSAGYGTVFCVNKDGSGFTVLKTFDYYSDGAWPGADLTAGSDGMLYGTTAAGPSSSAGTVFRVNMDGSGFAVLKTLSWSESGGLIEGSDGALYGTTGYTGPSSGGTVFRLNKDGTGFAVLKNFDSISDGSSPRGGLVEGLDGALYGTTLQGGASGYGAIFRLNKDGTGFSVLRSLDGGADGRSPFRVTEGSDGALYGTAALGGASDSGTIFRLLEVASATGRCSGSTRTAAALPSSRV